MLFFFVDFIELSFVRRNGNSVADYLARNVVSFGHCVWVKDVPPDLMSLINIDLVAFVSLT